MAEINRLDGSSSAQQVQSDRATIGSLAQRFSDWLGQAQKTLEQVFHSGAQKVGPAGSAAVRGTQLQNQIADLAQGNRSAKFNKELLKALDGFFNVLNTKVEVGNTTKPLSKAIEDNDPISFAILRQAGLDPWTSRGICKAIATQNVAPLWEESLPEPDRPFSLSELAIEFHQALAQSFAENLEPADSQIKYSDVLKHLVSVVAVENGSEPPYIMVALREDYLEPTGHVAALKDAIDNLDQTPMFFGIKDQIGDHIAYVEPDPTVPPHPANLSLSEKANALVKKLQAAFRDDPETLLHLGGIEVVDNEYIVARVHEDYVNPEGHFTELTEKIAALKGELEIPDVKIAQIGTDPTP